MFDLIRFDFLKTSNKKSEPYEEYILEFRLVRFKLSSGTYETILTNLLMVKYPSETIKELYASRWGIETSFNQLKYSVGLLYFHYNQEKGILQEIFANLIQFNLAKLIALAIKPVYRKRKYEYVLNFKQLISLVRQYIRLVISEEDLITLVRRQLISIRANRSFTRSSQRIFFIPINYKIA